MPGTAAPLSSADARRSGRHDRTHGSDRWPCEAAFVTEKELTLSDYAAVLRRRFLAVFVLFAVVVSLAAA